MQMNIIVAPCALHGQHRGGEAHQQRTSPVSVLPRWRFISASISALSASPSTSPMQLRSFARLDHVLPSSSLKTCRHRAELQHALTCYMSGVGFRPLSPSVIP